MFLVWTEWTGVERGEGEEKLYAEVELLPTPKVSDLSSLARRPYAGGIFAEGSIRVTEISAGAYTLDVLQGKSIPCQNTTAPRADSGAPINGHGVERSSNPKIDFWWETQEDGRGDDPAMRTRFRITGRPARKEGSLYWGVNLEEADEPRNRLGTKGQIGINDSDLPPGLLGGG